MFKDFAQLPVDCAGDALLFQCGTFSFTSEPLFHLNFTRQFMHEEDGEYAGMEQLGCTVYYPPVDELRALGTNLWSLDCASPEEFFVRVEALVEFQIPTTRQTPLRAEVDQERV